MTRPYCKCCDVDRAQFNPKTRLGGLCRACRTYERRYGKLPSEEILIKRQERRDERRHRRALLCRVDLIA